MVSRQALAARVKRLEELGNGLVKEIQMWEAMLWQGKELHIPSTELHSYIGAIRRASAAISEAQMAMEKALRQHCPGVL
jgi:hypothetical protein